MVQTGILTAVVSALIFGVYLFVYKRSFDGLPATVYLVTVESSGLVWYAVIAAATWPAGEPLVPATFGFGDGLLLVGVCAALASANIVSMRAIKVGDVSYVAPLNKLAPAFVLPLEIVLLALDPGFLQIAGLTLAVVAIYVANYRGGDFLTPFRRAAGYAPARLALLGSLLFAFADVGTRALLSGTELTPQAFSLATFVLVPLSILPLAARRVSAPKLRAAAPGIVTLAAFFAVGVHLKMVTFDLVPASVASPIINTQAVVAVLLGGVLLGERGLPRRLAAATLAVAGVGLIAAG